MVNAADNANELRVFKEAKAQAATEKHREMIIVAAVLKFDWEPLYGTMLDDLDDDYEVTDDMEFNKFIGARVAVHGTEMVE